MASNAILYARIDSLRCRITTRRVTAETQTAAMETQSIAGSVREFMNTEQPLGTGTVSYRWRPRLLAHSASIKG